MDTTAQDQVAETKTQEAPVPAGHVRMNFHFRTENIKDEDGSVIGKGKKHPDVRIDLPVPTDAELVDFIAANGKEAAFIRELVSDAVKMAARGQINDFRSDNKDTPVTPNIFDLSKLTFSSVAQMEKADRAADIATEVYDAFYEDYKAVLTALNTPPERIAKHIVIFKNQFRQARYDKPALGVLRDRLNMYAAKTENMEDNKEVFDVLTARLEKYLKADEKKLIEAL